MYQNVRVAATVLACALLSTAAGAAPVSADFTAEHGFFASGSCRTLSASGRSIGPGAELGLADQVSGACIFGAVGMDWDPISGILTVSALEGGIPGDAGFNYPFISVSIANVLFDLFGEQISAVAQLSQNLFTTLDNGRFDPPPLIAFAGNGLDIDWFVAPGGDDSLQMSLLAGGTATFQVTTSTSTVPPTPEFPEIPEVPTTVPEPSTLLLLSSGLALTRMGKRRQKQNVA